MFLFNSLFRHNPLPPIISSQSIALIKVFVLTSQKNTPLHPIRIKESYNTHSRIDPYEFKQHVDVRNFGLHPRYPLRTSHKINRHHPHRAHAQRPRLASRNTLRPLSLGRRHRPLHRHYARLFQRQSRVLAILHVLRAPRHINSVQDCQQ